MSAQKRLFAPETYPEDFQRFWKVYPARHGRKGNKKLACEMWQQLDTTERRWCMKAAQKMARAAEANEATCDAERFFVPKEWPKWMQYAEDEVRRDRQAVERVTGMNWDASSQAHRDEIRKRSDPISQRIVRLLDEGYFGVAASDPTTPPSP